MTSSRNNYDAIEAMIFEDDLKIEAVSIHKDLDLMLITLNTKSILCRKISSYKLLRDATSDALNNFELIGKGTGIHWLLFLY